MKERIINGFQVLSDGKTVWVNAPNGMNCGRFGPVGVDVHTSDEGHCHDCFARGGEDDWDRFVRGILEVHGIAIPSGFEPNPTIAKPKRRLGVSKKPV